MKAMNARDTINPTITITDTYDNMLAILEEIEHNVLERTKDNGRTNIAKKTGTLLSHISRLLPSTKHFPKSLRNWKPVSPSSRCGSYLKRMMLKTMTLQRDIKQRWQQTFSNPIKKPY